MNKITRFLPPEKEIIVEEDCEYVHIKPELSYMINADFYYIGKQEPRKVDFDEEDIY